jgi:alpha,alpha-trehalase
MGPNAPLPMGGKTAGGVSAAILGRYAVTPSDPWNVWGGYYETGSLIWRSRWGGGSAHTECREALARPAGPHKVLILRRIDAVDGPAA